MFGTVTTSKSSLCVYFGKQFGQGSTVIIQVMFGYKMSLVCSVRQVLLHSSKKRLLSLCAKIAPVYGNDNFSWDKLVCRVQQSDSKVSHAFLNWDSSFGTVIVLPLLLLVVLQSVLVVLQLSSVFCMCVLKRPFIIYLLWMMVIEESYFLGYFIILNTAACNT